VVEAVSVAAEEDEAEEVLEVGVEAEVLAGVEGEGDSAAVAVVVDGVVTKVIDIHILQSKIICILLNF
jgi:hypothetical protein